MFVYTPLIRRNHLTLRSYPLYIGKLLIAFFFIDHLNGRARRLDKYREFEKP